MAKAHKPTGASSMGRAVLPRGWRVRPTWRQVARRIVADHVEEVLSRLTRLRGVPVRGLTVTPAGTVRLILPDSAITVAGVAAGARARLVTATQPDDCYLADAGRYGRFW